MRHSSHVPLAVAFVIGLSCGDSGSADSDAGTGASDSESGGECLIGAEGCPCTAGGTCDSGLECVSGVCVPSGGDGDGDSGDGDGDGDSGDGDGDSGDGDGDSGDGDGDSGDGDGDSGDGDGDPCMGAPASEVVTYLGGSDFEHGRDVAYDCAGNLYVAGGTRSAEFPATIGGPVGSVDVFVAKLDPTGALVWAHRFGSANYDRAYALEIDGNGDVVVVGRAGSGFATTPGVLQPNFGGDLDMAQAYGQQDAFVAKLSSDGAMLWSTYFGSSGRDFIRDVAVDDDGDIYVAASQVTRDHPHVMGGSFDSTRAAMDCVAAKLSGDGSSVLWAGYLGGSGDDCPEPSIRVDPIAQTPIMIISTNAGDLPDTPGAYQSALAGGHDLFLAKIDPDGASLDLGTYFGGTGGDGLETHNLALYPDGRVALGFGTTSANLPTTPGVIQQGYGGTGGNGTGMNTNYPGDGYVGVLSADGSTLEFGTYLGGTLGDAIEGIAVAPDGRVYVSGGSFSANFPSAGGPYQANPGGNLDAFVAILATDLSTLDYASYVGGSNWDVARAVVFGPDGQIAATGETRSNDLATTPGAIDATFGGGQEFDAIVVQLAP